MTFVDDLGNLKSAIGTGFFVANASGALCLITNRHVLDYAYKKDVKEGEKFALCEIKISGKLGRRPDNYPLESFSSVMRPNISFHPNADNDVACIYPCMGLGEGVRIDYFIPYSAIAKDQDFEEKLMICDFLAFPGFPDWHDKAAGRPILRTGTIASDPRFDYSYNEKVRGECMAYEAFSFGGSSGSPVFALQKGPKPGEGISFPGYREVLLVGLNVGHLKIPNGDHHSGISYLIKSTAILNLIGT